MNGVGLMVSFVLSIVFAFACGSIAESKNRSAGVWGVLGFFGGLLVLIIILVLEDAYVPSQTYSSSKPMYPEPRKVNNKRPVVVKPKEKTFRSYNYIQEEPIRCPKVIVREYPEKTTVQLRVRSYDKVIKHVKVNMILTDIFDQKHPLESVIFDINRSDDAMWHHTNEVMLQTGTKLELEHLTAIDVIITSSVYEDQSKSTYDLSLYKKASDTETLGHLRSLYGDDVFENYRTTEEGFVCVCGRIETLSMDKCDFCQRTVESMSQEVDDLALMAGLKECDTLEEGLDVFNSLKHTLPEVACEQLQKKIDADLYVKRVYGMHDQKMKINQWIDILSTENI